MKLTSFIGLISLLFMLQLMAPLAFAGLGDDESSALKDQISFKAKHHQLSQKTSQGTFTVHELTTPMGVIREYVANDGKVFAVTWRGMVHPDFSILLSGYYQEYKTADENTRHTPGRASRDIQSANIKVTKWGHMRDVRGRAYIAKLLPPGLNVSELP